MLRGYVGGSIESFVLGRRTLGVVEDGCYACFRFRVWRYTPLLFRLGCVFSLPSCLSPGFPFAPPFVRYVAEREREKLVIIMAVA